MDSIQGSTTNDENNVDNLLILIKEQAKEIKLNRKKLEKLEEKFIKTNADLKSIINDKTNIENFLKTIFPKDMHDSIIKTEYGLYDSAEMSKMHLICESKKNNEFQQILCKYKNENLELFEKHKSNSKELEAKIQELHNLKKIFSTNLEQLNYYQNNYNELATKIDGFQIEKTYLIKLIDEKNQQIENLLSLEVENAELKAKSLLENLNTGTNNIGNTNGNKLVNNSTKNITGHNVFTNEIKVNNHNHNLRIVSNKGSLNVGCQTTEVIFSGEYVNNIEKQLIDVKQKLEKCKKDFNEYKDKSHKILLGSEENYSKILKSNEMLKKELAELHHQFNTTQQVNAALENEIQVNHEIKKNSRSMSFSKFKDSFPNGNVNIEYLKNVTIKYLEAIAIGNEFQIKILENVIFTILKISNDEKQQLEEKRTKSSFYYNLWYNAKAFLAARIYGKVHEDLRDEEKTDENTNMNQNHHDKIYSLDEIDLTQQIMNTEKKNKSNEI